MVYVEGQLPTEGAKAKRDLAEWLQRLAVGRSEPELALIRRAIELASQAHAGQSRASGEPYINHALQVADILVGLRLDHESLAAAILHDVVEDTPVTLAEVEVACGPTVARLVDGVTKMGAIGEYQQGLVERSRKEPVNAENLRKLLLAMAEDVRVVLIKLADMIRLLAIVYMKAMTIVGLSMSQLEHTIKSWYRKETQQVSLLTLQTGNRATIGEYRPPRILIQRLRWLTAVLNASIVVTSQRGCTFHLQEKTLMVSKKNILCQNVIFQLY